MENIVNTDPADYIEMTPAPWRERAWNFIFGWSILLLVRLACTCLFGGYWTNWRWQYGYLMADWVPVWPPRRPKDR